MGIQLKENIDKNKIAQIKLIGTFTGVNIECAAIHVLLISDSIENFRVAVNMVKDILSHPDVTSKKNQQKPIVIDDKSSDEENYCQMKRRKTENINCVSLSSTEIYKKNVGEDTWAKVIDRKFLAFDGINRYVSV